MSLENFDFEKILERISPEKEDKKKLTKTISEITKKILKISKKKGYDIDVVPGGSTAKDTFLKDNFDVDIFIRFKTLGDLSNMLEQLLIDLAGELGIAVKRIHGSRDYFQFQYKEFFFEIIPVKYIRSIEEVENITDMSPLHVFWIQNKLDEELKKNIRLAKQFCKSAGVYGAESHIKGLSGHVLDILVIYYGGFIEFVKAVSEWEKPVVIDPEKTHINVFKELNKAKLQSPLILIDPINPSRNAAAALSEEKFNGLVKRSKKFLEEPNKTFFEIQKFSFKKIFNKLTKEELLFVISIKPLEGKKDVIATKVLKIFEFLKTHLSLEDFEVTKSEWFFDEEESKLLIFVKNEQLSEYFEREGPPVKNIDSANHFREVHGDKAFERNGRLYVMIKRKFTNPLSYMQHLLKQEYVSEKINNYRLELFVK